MLDFHLLTSLTHYFSKKEEKNPFSWTLGSNGGDLAKSGSAEFFSPGNGELKNGRGPQGMGSLGSLWHP